MPSKKRRSNRSVKANSVCDEAFKSEDKSASNESKPRPRGRPPKRPLTANNLELNGLQAKRRKTGQSENVFTFKEKKAFYECLNEHGFGVIFDHKILEKTFPNRTRNEIKFFIENYSRKGREMYKRFETSEELDTSEEKAPLEKWCDIIHQSVPTTARKNDMSSVFADVFETLAQQFDDKSLSMPSTSSSYETPNYGCIYSYISEILRSKYPQELAPLNAFVVLKLIEELNEVFKRDECARETDFLKNANWQQRSAANYFNALYLQRVTQNGAEDSSQREVSANETESYDNQFTTGEALDNDSDTRDISSWLNFPKIRKIADCLNPIQVPIELLEDEHNRWQK